MIQNNISSINFGAKYLKTVDIKKLDKQTGQFYPTQASFVEYDPKNLHDLKTLVRTSHNWKKGLFVHVIAQKAGYLTQNLLPPQHNKIYILTSQNDNFNKIHAKYILGLADIEKLPNGKDELEYFEVNPKHKHGSENREYKNIGEAMMNELKNLCKKSISLYSSSEGTKFYEKEGFKIIDKSFLKYIWRK